MPLPNTDPIKVTPAKYKEFGINYVSPRFTVLLRMYQFVEIHADIDLSAGQPAVKYVITNCSTKKRWTCAGKEETIRVFNRETRRNYYRVKPKEPQCHK